MAEQRKQNPMSGSSEGPDFDDPHHDYVAAKPPESEPGARLKPTANAPESAPGAAVKPQTGNEVTISEPGKDTRPPGADNVVSPTQ